MKTEILRLDNVSLQMSGIMQLERFNLQIFSGEIMGLMALNAHGVSSLVSLLQSNTPVHFGRVYYCEQLVNSHIYSRTTPNEIVVIEQKSHLVNGLTVGDNVFVLSGVERRWLLHTQSFRGRLQELEQAVGVDIPCNRQVEELSLFERCMVELLKAWESGARLVLLWNISHFLAGTDIGRLHYAIRHFASRGMAFIYISNSYEELCGLCDRIAVMYNGSVIKVQEMVSGASEDIHALLQQFTGTTSSPPRSAMSRGSICLNLSSVSTALLKQVDLAVYSGECLAIHTEDRRLLDGMRRLATGQSALLGGKVLIDGQPIHRPMARDQRVAYIAENPSQMMLFQDMSYLRNLTFCLPRQIDSWFRRRSIYRSLRRELTPELGAVFDKDIRDLNTQEKYALIFRRVLLQQPRVVFFEQPFWGNDVLLQQHIERQVQLLLAKKIAVVVLIVGIYDAFPLAERTLIYKNGHLLTQ